MTGILTLIGMTKNLFDFSWVKKIINFFDGFVQDIGWLYAILPTWLQFFCATILFAMVVIAVLRVLKEVVPFV